MNTLEHLITDNNHTNACNVILQIDIEGAEWDVFEKRNQYVSNIV